MLVFSRYKLCYVWLCCCVSQCIYTCVYVCVCVCMCVYVCVCVLFVGVCVWNGMEWMQWNVCMCVCEDVPLSTILPPKVLVFLSAHTHAHTHTHIFIHMNIHICTRRAQAHVVVLLCCLANTCIVCVCDAPLSNSSTIFPPKLLPAAHKDTHIHTQMVCRVLCFKIPYYQACHL
jgi:hypothetical protein